MNLTFRKLLNLNLELHEQSFITYYVMDVQGFLNILFNHNIEKRLQDILKPVIELSVAEIFKPIQKAIDVKLNELTTTDKLLQAEVTSHKDEVADLQNTNKNLSDRLAVAEGKINDLEQYSRLDNLVITGLTITTAEVLQASDHGQSSMVMRDKVVEFCGNVLGVQIDLFDISAAYFCQGSQT